MSEIRQDYFEVLILMNQTEIRHNILALFYKMCTKKRCSPVLGY